MDDFNERYNRQLILGGFGEKAQRALEAARVLVIGAGGLGCPVLQYLAAAGVGTIGIIDHDSVALSNLHRQVLFTTADIGLLKAEVASKKLSALNPPVKINTYPFQLDPINAVQLISEYDYVVDGSDNFSTRYLVNDVCVFLGKPLVYGAVSEYEGQVAVFNVIQNGASINYRDLFPLQPGEGEFLNCAEAGALGVLPGIIGSMQAAETIKLITGTGEPLINRMLTYNLLIQEIFTIELQAGNPDSYRIPASAGEFAATDYGEGCRMPIAMADGEVEEITREQRDQAILNHGATVIDVREESETPPLAGVQYIQIPMSVFPVFAAGIEGDPVILFCQSGIRSIIAAELLAAAYPAKEYYSLKGGISRLTIR